MLPKRQSGGFTLAEVVMAILIAGIALTGLMAAILYGVAAAESGRSSARASIHARVVLEEMRRVADDDPAGMVATDWPGWAAGQGLTGLQDEAITVTYADPAADPVEATVTVSWTEKERARSLQWTGLFTRR